MNIKTKFDLGQSVYCYAWSNRRGRFIADAGQYIIRQIDTSVDIDEDTGEWDIIISYLVYPKMHPCLNGLRLKEKCIHASYREAQKAAIEAEVPEDHAF